MWIECALPPAPSLTGTIALPRAGLKVPDGVSETVRQSPLRSATELTKRSSSSRSAISTTPPLATGSVLAPLHETASAPAHTYLPRPHCPQLEPTAYGNGGQP